MNTVVFLHAHPDDECLLTAGTMAALAASGDRVVLVTATSGERGELASGVDVPDDDLGAFRNGELARSAAVLGVSRLVMLGYRDSGMEGTDGNDDPDCFAQTDPGRAAARVAAILREEAADAVVTYDERGGYGHPDHIQVHRVGTQAAALAGTPVVYLAVIDADRMARQIEAARAAGLEVPDVDASSFGVPGERVTTRVDVRAFAPHKRASLACHASQAGDTAFFLGLDDDTFAEVLGLEEYVRVDAPAGTSEPVLLPERQVGDR